MRWPFGPPHLTLKPSKKNTKKTPKTKQTKKKTKKTKKKRSPKKNSENTKKNAFQLSVKFFHFFGWLFKISLFWHLGPKSAHPQNTIKIGVSGPFFFEEQLCVTKRPFLDRKKPNPDIPVIIFFLPFSSLTTTKNTKVSWNPYFYSVLANLKREFSKN